ncbi:MAG: UDP-2,3-diacylglucosamine diphosphatase [Bacteroidetes bacterium]|nr:UDP-2,3-diacylglucosamine diphosphatase [Bacteroidota bacterium]
MKRQLDVVILSDLHLGSYHCRARELLQYLNSIQPKSLVLNGDVIERAAISKRYFPRMHMQIINSLLQLTLSGTNIYYVTGNHDDYLRKFLSISLGPIHLREKLDFHIKDKHYRIFHGDVLDAQKMVSPVVRYLGDKGYHLLLRLNRVQNRFRKVFGKPPTSLARKVKDKLGKAQSYIDQFERTAAKLAIKEGFDIVICGHIHQPTIKEIHLGQKSITYMNSGDWVENLTALELRFGKWELYEYNPLDYTLKNPKLSVGKKKKNYFLENNPSIRDSFRLD